MLPPRTLALLRQAGLRNEVSESFAVTPDIIRSQREVPYEQMWTLANDNNWFHIRFEDLSIIQFQSEPSPSYHFMECPLDVPKLSEFLESLEIDYRDRHRPDVEEMYFEAVQTAGLRRHVTPIRYDRDFLSYRKGAHPAAHLHVGLENNVRLALSKEMTPWAFLLFVIRQKYPENWERLHGCEFSKYFERQIRGALLPVPDKYWQTEDLWELALS